MKNVLVPDADTINSAAQLLARDELVVIPTETVYGLAANALSRPACEKIFALKNRPYSDPLIVHVASPSAVDSIAGWTNFKELQQLTHAFWPGPLTIILPRKACVPDIVTSGQTTVAIRCPDHPVALELLKICQFPLAAPSANRFGKISPTTPVAVLEEFREKCPPILDGGPCRGGIESTIVGIETQGERCLKIFRPGLITSEQISEITSLPILEKSHNHNTKASDLAHPGSLASHYSPNKPLFMLKPGWRGMPFDNLEKIVDRKFTSTFSSQNIGWILTQGAAAVPGLVCNINPHGNFTDAAASLYSAMRALDREASVSIILTELAPEQGIGVAINDRLRRASSKN